jgi:heparan-alpha-glucosaminide N-acetyltransferase
MQNLPKRLLSIDMLRALTMFLMIFVNDASGVKHIPEWIDHAKGDADGMGFADTIFPAFLFILGLSLPFALNNRIKKGDSSSQILIYILTRSAALLIMGFYHVNIEDYKLTGALILRAAWVLIVTVAFFLIWLDYPETMAKVKKYTLMGSGLALLIAMAIVYRGTDEDGHAIGMHTSWWGILGIIGWSYLVCACVYFAAKGRLVVLVAALIVFVIINIAEHTGILPEKLWVIGDASAVTLTMGGIVVSRWYAEWVEDGKARLIPLFFIVTGALLIIAGLLIRPYADGISKIRSTPAWVFICSGITILMFQLFIYIVDMRGQKAFLKTIRPAGTSTLTCYLMPYFQVFLMELFHVKFPYFLRNGLPGLLRSIAVSFILIWLVGLMEKKRLRLKI